MRPRLPLLTLLIVTVLSAHTTTASTVVVTNTNDVGGGSLRQAIADAAAGDTIVFQIPGNDPGYVAATGYFVITLTGTNVSTTSSTVDKTLVIDKDLTIDGSAQKITVRRGNSAPADFSVFSVAAGRTVTLTRIWVSNGNLTHFTGGGAVGAGIRNAGNLLVRECMFTGNAGADDGGAIGCLTGTMRIENSTFSANNAYSGGAICVLGQASCFVQGCTFNANTAAEGGAIYAAQHPTLAIRSSTIYGNMSNPPVPGQTTTGGGLRVLTGAAVTLQNTIVVGNTADIGPDEFGDVTSEGHNLIGTVEKPAQFNGPSDQVGVTTVQARLEALAENGGPRPTMRPRLGSFALDKGKRSVDPDGQLINVDARGFPRPVERPESNTPTGDGSDIGAVELGSPQPGPTFTVNTIAEHNDDECTTDDCTLVEAVIVSNAVVDANTINFTPGLAGEITTDTISPLGLPLFAPVTINGPGPAVLTLTSRGNGRILNATAAGVTVSGLGLVRGHLVSGSGGAVTNTGNLTLKDCELAFNDTGANGGAIFNATNGTLTLNRCALIGNNANAGFGGGVYNDGAFSATNCTFWENGASRGGAVISRFNNGDATMTLRNCTFAENQAMSATAGVADGGGIYAEGGAQQHRIANTIVASNASGTNPDLRGQYTSDGNNFIGNVANATGFADNVKGDQVGTPGATKDPLLHGGGSRAGGLTVTRALLAGSPCIDAGNDALAPATDQRGFARVGVSDIGAFEYGAVAPTPTRFANISTRMRVETGDNVLIGGFIVTGSVQKRIIIRALGPSLPVDDRLADPMLELYDGGGTLLAANDNWQDAPNKQEIIDSTVAPANALESAILTDVGLGAHTAIVRGSNGGTGVGLVEVYDIGPAQDSKLANISTRGRVLTADNVMIGGLIITGSAPQKVIVRAIGPSLQVEDRLANPSLQLFDVQGNLLSANDDWKETQQLEIEATTIPPSNDLESAIVTTLPPASYTAVVRGVSDSTGVALVELYALD